MKKLNKVIKKAISYQKEIEKMEAEGIEHPYSDGSLKTKFYNSVRAELFEIQNGLCAYCETYIGDTDIINDYKWERGKLESSFPAIDADIEHFDPRLKKTKGWLWSNLFLVNSFINQRIKKEKDIDRILKPDDADYDPYRLLSYNLDLHIFTPNADTLNDDEYRRVQNMIVILGINNSPIKDRRRDLIDAVLNKDRFGIENLEEYLIKEYPTAFEMIKRNRATV